MSATNSYSSVLRPIDGGLSPFNCVSSLGIMYVIYNCPSLLCTTEAENIAVGIMG